MDASNPRVARVVEMSCGDSRPFDRLKASSLLSGRAKLDSFTVKDCPLSHYRATRPIAMIGLKRRRRLHVFAARRAM